MNVHVTSTVHGTNKPCTVLVTCTTQCVTCVGPAEVLPTLSPVCSLWLSKVWTRAEHMVSHSTEYNDGCALNPTASVGIREQVNSYSLLRRVPASVLTEANFCHFF